MSSLQRTVVNLLKFLYEVVLKAAFSALGSKYVSLSPVKSKN